MCTVLGCTVKVGALPMALPERLFARSRDGFVLASLLAITDSSSLDQIDLPVALLNPRVELTMLLRRRIGVRP